MEKSHSIPVDFRLQDRIYLTSEVRQFFFGEEVARVFDDMAARSIPNYFELQLLLCSLANRFYQKGCPIYDIGCSTATSLIVIHKMLQDRDPLLVGIDSSTAMLEKARQKLESFHLADRIKLYSGSVEDFCFNPACFIFANYTLQFIEPSSRSKIVKALYKSLVPGGAFLLSEKMKISDQDKHSVVTDLYQDFKRRNGYSDIEIARKREALKGVLIPLSEQENLELLEQAGFSTVIPMLRGYEFQSWLCLKDR